MTNNPAPRVSVCIPTINRPAFLREAIASVLAQTWTDYEIIVADNSADPELQRRIDDVVGEFQGTNLVLRRHAKQVEAAANFNSLIDAARAEFCVFLPDDDHFCPTFLARAVEALERHPQCAFTFADHWVIRADGTRDVELSRRNSIRFGRDVLREGVYTYDQLFGLVLKQSLCLQTILFRRSVLNAFRFVPGLTALDQSLYLRMSEAGTDLNAYYLDERMFEYRVHGDQVTSVTRREVLVRDHICLLEALRSIPPLHREEVRNKLGREYLSLAFLEAERGARRDAREHAVKSVRVSPDLRSLLGTFLILTVPSAVPTIRRLEAVVRGAHHA
jgi:glycosyltransferase involved in cell wall biosynthesis